MKIIIVGGGVVGYSLANQLLYEKHSVALIEQDPDIASRIAEKIDAQVLTASGSSPSALEGVGITDADMVIAVTPVDEINLLVCSIAKQYGVSQRIARLRNREFVSADRHVSLIDLGVTDFIFPEQVVVDSILQYIETPGASDAVNFENGNILLRGYHTRPSMPIVGKSLVDIRKLLEPEVLLVAAVIRDGKGIIPPWDFVIEPYDRVFALFPRSATGRFMGLISESDTSVKRVILTGNNLSTLELAATLQDRIGSVILADPDRAHAEMMATELTRTDVIHGDCTEADTLKEIDIKRADFFIASSTEADYNLLSALLAKSEGAREVIAVSMEDRQDHLFHSIGIDHVINPRVTAAREIMQIISRGYIGSVVRLGEAEIEAIRLTVPEKSKIIGVPLKKAWKKIRKDAIIGMIIRDESMIIPDGETTIEPGDHVITVAYTRVLPMIRKLFNVKN